tara:strand:- start:43 stop:297 length:255 start_codon:yes stop_codon:yes gene_type:complete
MTFSNPRPEEDIAEDITISTETTGDITFNTDTNLYQVDPLGYMPPSHDHSELCAKLDEVNAKLDHLLEHAHQEYTLVPKKNEGT